MFELVHELLHWKKVHCSYEARFYEETSLHTPFNVNV